MTTSGGRTASAGAASRCRSPSGSSEPFGLIEFQPQRAVERDFPAATTPGSRRRLRGGVGAEWPVVIQKDIPLDRDAIARELTPLAYRCLPHDVASSLEAVLRYWF